MIQKLKKARVQIDFGYACIVKRSCIFPFATIYAYKRCQA